MEKFLKPYDKEFMRMAMLKHEETFKEQVHELHRLYRIQKIMMRNIGTNNTQSNQEIWSSKNSINFAQMSIMKLDLERPADQDYQAAESSGDHHNRAALEIIDESEIELTLGPSTYNRRHRKKTETTLTSDSGPSSFSSSSTGSSNNVNRTSTSHHQKITSAKKSEELSGGQEMGSVHQVPDMALGNYQSENKTTSSTDHVDEQLRQERLKQSPWLFQVLSLNMT